MDEILIVYILGIMGAVAFGLVSLKVYFEIKITAKSRWTLASLSNRVSKLENAFKELTIDTEGLDIGQLGDLGSILNQLGIDESILKNPLVKSLVGKVVKNMSKNQENTQSEINFEG